VALLSAVEDTEYTYQVVVSYDDDDNDGNELSWGLSNAPCGMVLSTTGVLTWTPGEGSTRPCGIHETASSIAHKLSVVWQIRRRTELRPKLTSSP
jgi:hypothetical protein